MVDLRAELRVRVVVSALRVQLRLAFHRIEAELATDVFCAFGAVRVHSTVVVAPLNQRNIRTSEPGAGDDMYVAGVAWRASHSNVGRHVELALFVLNIDSASTS